MPGLFSIYQASCPGWTDVVHTTGYGITSGLQSNTTYSELYPSVINTFNCHVEPSHCLTCMINLEPSFRPTHLALPFCVVPLLPRDIMPPKDTSQLTPHVRFNIYVAFCDKMPGPLTTGLFCVLDTVYIGPSAVTC